LSTNYRRFGSGRQIESPLGRVRNSFPAPTAAPPGASAPRVIFRRLYAMLYGKSIPELEICPCNCSK